MTFLLDGKEIELVRVEKPKRRIFIRKGSDGRREYAITEDLEFHFLLKTPTPVENPVDSLPKTEYIEPKVAKFSHERVPNQDDQK